MTFVTRIWLATKAEGEIRHWNNDRVGDLFNFLGKCLHSSVDWMHALDGVALDVSFSARERGLV
jgi:hypothetical protein